MGIVTDSVVLIGKESVGKSQLVASLTGSPAHVANFRGSTVTCEIYGDNGREFVDTPGILRRSDNETTRAALARLSQSDTVLLVAKATHLDDDLADLLPLVAGKRGAIALTYWDKMRDQPGAAEALSRIGCELHLEIVPFDARRLSLHDRARLRAALDAPQAFPEAPPSARAGWCVEPRRPRFHSRLIGALLAFTLLFGPTLAAVGLANSFAAVVEPAVQEATARLVEELATWPSPFKIVLVGRYGFVTMFPLMLVWALPTVVLFALLLAVYKASGLIDRLTVALDPFTRPLGLAARDLVRVLMGFGCNVPAVINTRACSACSRGSCLSAIAFGSACSYQLGATLAVFAAAKAVWLVVPYLVYLGLTTLIYSRLTSPPEARSGANLLVLHGRDFLQWPGPSAILREASSTLRHFFVGAMPVFLLITFFASLLDGMGMLSVLSRWLAPVMRLFGLPPQAASAVVLASIRKDGILLLGEPKTAVALSDSQILTAAYLAGVLFPCLVTAWTIAREQSWRFAARLLARQAVAAVGFTLILTWTMKACFAW